MNDYAAKTGGYFSTESNLYYLPSECRLVEFKHQPIVDFLCYDGEYHQDNETHEK